jgi:probable O-glycosylation ligase (exosortase A-associated)
VVRTREEILGLVSAVALSLAYYGAKGGWFTLVTGGAFRVWGPPSTVIEGNNELAVGLIITIPLLYYMVLQADKLLILPLLEKLGAKWVKRLILVLMLLCAISAIGSHSRGALLAMIAMASMLWWRSKSKLAVGMVVLLLSPALIFFMPDEWSSRMGTIQTYEADQSAMGRINAWTMAINIANNRIFGAGFTTDSALIYQMYAPNPSELLVAHSIYFQVLGAHGYIGLFIYLLFWFLTYRTAGRLTKVARGRPDLEWVEQLGAMIKVSIVGFAVGGAFLSLAFWDMPFYFMVLLVVTENWVKNNRAEDAARGVAQPVVSNSMGRLEASR